MKTVLLVDDYGENLEVLTYLVEKLGHRVLRSSGGHEAFIIFQSTAIDLVLSDLQMPEGDGLWLLKALRDSGHQTPFILLTADLRITKQEIIQAGASDFLEKPYPIEQLKKMVQVWLP